MREREEREGGEELTRRMRDESEYEKIREEECWINRDEGRGENGRCGEER